MIKKALLIPAMLLILLLPVVFAAPPPDFVQGSETTAAWTVAVPKVEYIQQGQDFDFHVHVFNVSGAPITNTSPVQCSLHVYNNTGNHVYTNESMKFTSSTTHGFDWEATIPSTVLQYKGMMPYIAQCNSSSEGGFLSGELDVKTTSQITDATSNDANGSVAVTLFILACTLLLFALPSLMDGFTKNKLANLLITRGMYVIGLYLMMFNSAILATISKASAMGLEKEMFRYMWIFGTAGYLLIFVIGIKTLLDFVQLYSNLKFEKRMGGKGEGGER